MRKIHFFYIISFFIPLIALCQPAADTTKIYSWKINPAFDTVPAKVDTLLFDFQKYHPAFYYSFSNSSVSNNGQATMSNIFIKELDFSGMPYFARPNWPYQFNLSDIAYFNTKSPYTECFYSLGQKKDQSLKVVHSQNIRNDLNFGFRYHLASIEGNFKRQKSRNNSLLFFSSYTGNRYSVHAAGSWNKMRSLLNGGIVNDSLFENTIDETPTINVNLNNAESGYVKKSVQVTQKINFFKIGTDTDTSDIKTHKFLLSIGHKIANDSWSRTYKDVKTDFYADWFADSVKTNDSVFYKTFSNTFFFSLNENALKWLPLGLNSGVSKEVTLYGNYKVRKTLFDTAYHNTIIHAYFYNNSGRNLNFMVGAKFYYSGYKQNDFNAIAEFKKHFREKKDSCWLSLSVTMNRQTPELFYNRFFGNNFEWYQDCLPHINETVKLNFFRNRLHLNAFIAYTILDNHIYFDSLAVPRQLSGSTNVMTAGASHHFRLWKFHFINNIVYQKSGDDIIRVPDLIVNSSFFLRALPFQSKLPLHVGFDISYNSDYFGYAYMPATNVFYLQNLRKFGGHPFVDFFIAAQRKTVRVFLKAEHVNALSFISKRDYYLARLYPANGFGIRFGVSWRFAD